MAGQFEGKVALVTGGSAGIGRATALVFAATGARVVVADVNAEGGEDTARQVRQAGGEAIFVKTDVASAAEVRALIEETVGTYGRLDYACNNAGVEGPQAPTADYSQETWQRVIAINLTGVWLCMKYEIQQMLKQSKGAIVNMSSVAGVTGFRNIPAYVASKHGVVGLT
jgi:NAD(P)-dependent dehydrogenase (short-subunit alcohol dehydrogenase family)